MSRSLGDQCYMRGCDEKPTSREHVPPKCFFPEEKYLPNEYKGENHRKKLMTVPSCDIHNSNKSGDDEWAKFLVGSMLTSGGVGQKTFIEQYKKSERAKKSIDAQVRKIEKFIPFRVFDEEKQKSFRLPGFELDQDRFDKVFMSMARAIYFYNNKKRLEEDLVVFTANIIDPNNPSVNEDNAKLAQDLEKIFDSHFNDKYQGWNQEIFKYQVGEDNGRFVMYRMVVYRGFTVIVSVVPENEQQLIT